MVICGQMMYRFIMCVEIVDFKNITETIVNNVW